MDKSWIGKSKFSSEYVQGVSQFLRFAFENACRDGLILCPCIKCVNLCWKPLEDVQEHLICNGFLSGYTHWVCHGETSLSTYESHLPKSSQELRDVGVEESLGVEYENEIDLSQFSGGGSDPRQSQEELNVEATKFFKLLDDLNQELYPGFKKMSRLSVILELFQIKVSSGMSNESFNLLLSLLKRILPEGETLPNSYRETKNMIKELGLGYNKIHACPNDCMLYLDERANEESCYVCGASRWVQCDNNDFEGGFSGKKKKPIKVLRHFPLKPRLQKLFMSPKIASAMLWHDKGRKKDGKLRHPADSLAWKSFDLRYPDFALDPRNVRLGLATDGFNPFRTMNNKYSVWPVMVIPYNLPPWLSMKESSFILSLVIPGRSGPGNNIDVYLQPLVRELKELWEVGVNTFDVFAEENFQLRAALMWTINDFPAYGDLSGWNVKSRFACPHCCEDTCSLWLHHGGKYCFMGHRRFLDINHEFRTDSSFDGTQELKATPISPSGSMVLSQVDNIYVTFGKKNPVHSDTWKKKSIFFNLPYWEHNLLRHNLDVMHVEKNVCDNILGTLLNIDGKTKDNLKARLDLQAMGIRKELHPREDEDGRLHIPLACYWMSTKEKDVFLEVLKSIKVPDGFSSNISQRVSLKDRKILPLKSHDNHILMEEFLGLALRGLLPRDVTMVVVELGQFFKALCDKVLAVEELERLQSKIVLTLCQMEKIFTPSFFTIMVHLVVHLVEEAKITGPVYYRWMYPVERFLFKLKSYKTNKAHPEGSIAEAYLAEECMVFCSRYLEEFETQFGHSIRNYDVPSELRQRSSLFPSLGRPLGKAIGFELDEKTWVQAHRYVLFQCEAIHEFQQEFEKSIRRQQRRKRARPIEISDMMNTTFHEWFYDWVAKMDTSKTTTDIRYLSQGPNRVATRYNGYVINGLRFHTKSRERDRKTQNSGVAVIAKTTHYPNARGGDPIVMEDTYYGVLTDIIELNYFERFKVVLFRCDWASLIEGKGIKKDQYGFILVNFSNLIHTGNDVRDEPFVLASQAKQVFYVQDPWHQDWKIVLNAIPRDLYDMGVESIEEEICI